MCNSFQLICIEGDTLKDYLNIKSAPSIPSPHLLFTNIPLPPTTEHFGNLTFENGDSCKLGQTNTYFKIHNCFPIQSQYCKNIQQVIFFKVYYYYKIYYS